MTAHVDPVIAAHARCIHHRGEIESSERCGCFFCCTTFGSNEIKEWTDEDQEGTGQTALCPRCGIDSVIGDESGFKISVEFMASMERQWFGLR